MTAWRDTKIGNEIELSYGKSLPAYARELGPFPVFGSNGCVGHHKDPLLSGPGIIVGRKGSVGEVVYSDQDFWPIDTTYYVVNKGGHDWRFLYHLLSRLGLNKLNSHSAVPGLNRENVYSIQVSLPDVQEQRMISRALDAVQNGLGLEDEAVGAAQDLKRAAMRALFTKGLRGEARKETEIGPVPESWEVGRLDRYATVVSSRMSYSELEAMQPAEDAEAVKVLGIKVADMNLPGNEVELTAAILEKHVPRAIAEYRCAPPRTIIFPKRGAAIATNKKRISNEWTAFDPNVVGVIGRTDIDQVFLFHWFQTFDLRTIAEPGPTPQLNKKNLEPLIIPVPRTLDEQREIVAILDAIDRKIDLHRRKRAVLDELFKALLHKLMTGEIRVADLDLSALDAKPVTEVAA
jgi:type I restriction enzyme S subunit